MKKKTFITVAIIGVLFSFVYHPLTEKANAKDLRIPFPAVKSQFFCGYCHVLTHPRVMKKAYTSWRASKHKDVGCVECHYPPDRLYSEIPQHKKIPKDERFSPEGSEWDYMNTELEVLARLTTILNMEDSVVRTKPRIDDLSCSSAGGNPTTGIGKVG
jgi:hypothetical protein